MIRSYPTSTSEFRLLFKNWTVYFIISVINEICSSVIFRCYVFSVLVNTKVLCLCCQNEVRIYNFQHFHIANLGVLFDDLDVIGNLFILNSCHYWLHLNQAFQRSLWLLPSVLSQAVARFCSLYLICYFASVLWFVYRALQWRANANEFLIFLYFSRVSIRKIFQDWEKSKSTGSISLNFQKLAVLFFPELFTMDKLSCHLVHRTRIHFTILSLIFWKVSLGILFYILMSID